MENSPTPGSNSASPQTFTGRVGTRDEGIDFAELTIISKCLQLAFDSNVTEFNISSDDAGFGDFDAVVIETKYINGKEEKIAYQLKHVEDEDGLLTPKILGGTGKKFGIAKYYQNSGKIPHDFSLILYTNKKFKMDNNKLTMDCKIGGADILVDVLKTDHKNLHEFRVNKAENIPKPNSDNYENFLKRFKLQSNQENTTQLESRLMKEFLKIHGTEDTFRRFRDFIRRWKKEKKKKLDKRTVTIKIVESLLTPFVKTISHDLYYTDFGATLRKAILSFNFTTFEETNEVIHKIWISGVSDREIYKCGIKQYLLTEGLDKIMDEKMRAHKYSLISWHLNQCPLIVEVTKDSEEAICEAVELLKKNGIEDRRLLLLGQKVELENSRGFVNLHCLKNVKHVNQKIKEKFHKLQDLVAHEDFPRITSVLKMTNPSSNIGVRAEEIPEFYVPKALPLIMLDFNGETEDLILMECNSKREDMKKRIKNAKIVDVGEEIIEKCFRQESLGSLPEPQFQHSYALKEVFEDVISNIPCEFQGRKCKFKEILDTEDEVLKVFTVDSFDKIKNGYLIIGEKEEEEFYMNRLLHRIMIDFAFVRKINSDEAIVIICNGEKDEVESRIARDEHRKITLTIKEEFVEINNNVKNCHYFRYSQQNLEWIRTRGEISDALKASRINTNQLQDELEILTLQNEINIVCGDVGIGKSAMLKHFKNKYRPDFWVLHISPGVSYNFNQDVFGFITSLINNADFFEKQLVTLLYEKKKIVFFWDIVIELENSARSLIKQVQESGFVQWIFSRSELKSELEETFGTFARNVEELSEKQRRDYIHKHLSASHHKKEIENFTENMEQNLPRVVVGVNSGIGSLLPLSLMIILLKVQDLLDLTKQLFGQSSITVFGLCQLVIEGNLKKYFKIHREFESFKEKYLDKYKIVGAHICLEPMLNLKFTESEMELLQETTDPAGILNIGKHKPMTFQHQIFAEYFAALFLAQNHEKIKDLEKIYFRPGFKHVKFMLDSILAKNSKFHTAVLFDDLRTVQTFHIICVEDIVERTPLQICLSWESVPNLPPLNPFEDYQWSNFLNIREMTSYLLKHGNEALNRRDKLLEMNCFDYAQGRLAHIAVLTKDINIVKFVFEEYVSPFSVQKGDTPLMLAGLISDEKIVQFLVHAGEDVNSKNIHGNTPLHYCLQGEASSEIAAILVNVGAKLEEEDSSGYRALHYAVSQGDKETVKLLLEKNCKVDCSSQNGWTPLMIAAWKGNLEIIDLLISKKADVHLKNSDGETAEVTANRMQRREVSDFLQKARNTDAEKNKKFDGLPERNNDRMESGEIRHKLDSEEFETFPRLEGRANGHGVFYQNNFIAFWALKMAFNEKVQDFRISSDVKHLKGFDDVIFKIMYLDNETPTQKAYQLKHKKKSAIKKSDLFKSQKGDFSIPKYFQNFQDCKEEFKQFDLIIFTNAKFEVDLKEEFQLMVGEDNQPPVLIKVKKLTKKTAKVPFITNRKDIYKFCLAKPINEKKTELEQNIHCFLQKFYLYAQQSNFQEIELKVRETFFNEKSYDDFLKFVKYWTSLDNPIKLNKETVLFKAAECLLAPYLATPYLPKNLAPYLATMYLPRNFVSFSEKILQDFDLIAIDGEMENFWHHEEYVADKERDQEIAERYRDERPDPFKLLWHSKQIPFVINLTPENTKVIYRAINLCKWNGRKRFFVLIGKVDVSKLGGWKIFESCADLLKGRTNLLKDFRTKIRGRGFNSLSDFIQEDSDLAKCFGFADLFNMATENSTFCLGTEINLDNNYIERFIPRVIISANIFKSLPPETIFIISRNGEPIKYLPDEVKVAEKHSGSTIIQVQHFCDDFQKICTKYRRSQLHHLSLTSDYQLEWVESKGGVEDLRPFLIESQGGDLVKDENILSRFRHKTNLICADPGMGKSFMAAFLESQCPLDYWPIKIQLRDHLELFKQQRNNEEIFDYVLKLECKHKIFLEVFMKKKKVLFIWDGIDELSDIYIPHVITVVKILEKEGFRQWITSRNHLRKQMEEELAIFALTITYLSEEEQMKYICSRMGGIAPDDIKVKRIIKTVSESKDNDILAIPLQLRMLTEIFIEDNFAENDHLVLTDIYMRFFHKKLDFFKTKTMQENNVINSLVDIKIEKDRERLVNKYQKAALFSIFREDVQRMFGVSRDVDFFTEIQKGDEYGFIVQMNDDIPSFAHLTYAEFFAAWYMDDNWKGMEKEKLRVIMVESKYKTIRYFFNMLTTKGSHLHLAAVQRNFAILEQSEDFGRDSLGRSVLQLLSICSPRHTPEMLNYDDKDSPKKHLVQKLVRLEQNLDQKDKLLDFDIFEYCDKFESLAILDAISNSTYQDRITSLNYFKNHLDWLIFYCVRCNYGNLLKLVPKIDFFEYTDQNVPLTYLHTAARYCNDGEILAKILKEERYIVIIINKEKYLQTPLELAARHNSCSTIAAILIESGAEVNLRSSQGESPLHLCVLSGNKDTCNVLIQHKAEINQQNALGQTPLYHAVKGKRSEIVELLLTHDANPNHIFETKSLLHLCSEYDQAAIASHLIRKGADTNVKDQWVQTPLLYALIKNSKKVSKVLLGAGADVNIPDFQNRSPLHIVANHSDDEEMVIALIRKGANVNQEDQSKQTPLHYAINGKYENIAEILLENGAHPDIDISEGKTPLHHFSDLGNIKMVELLIRKRSNINCTSESGRTPLHDALERGHVEVGKMLLKAGANPNITLSKNRRPLHLYSEIGDAELVKLLVEHGAEVNYRNSSGRTALHYAVNRKREEVLKVLLQADADPVLDYYLEDIEALKLLIDSGANVNYQNRSTALCCALEKNQKEVVHLLLEAGADVNLPGDSRGKRPLHLCSDQGDEDMVKILVQKGANIDEEDKLKQTPLHYAVRGAWVNVVEMLLKKDADPNVVDSEDRTPLDLCSDLDDRETAEEIGKLLKSKCETVKH